MKRMRYKWLPELTTESAHAPRVVVAVSGGMDSAVLLAAACGRYGAPAVHALYVDYSSKHREQEYLCARWLARTYTENGLLTVPIKGDLWPQGASALTDPDVDMPTGAYDSPSMAITVVPGRNLLILSLLAARAEALAKQKGVDAVVLYGAHGGDHAIYPDCRPKFVQCADRAVQASSEGRVRVFAPMLRMDKGDIAIMGTELHVPFEHTWTCYEGKRTPCGTCGACNERAAAFLKAGRPDPEHVQPPTTPGEDELRDRAYTVMNTRVSG